TGGGLLRAPSLLWLPGLPGLLGLRALRSRGGGLPRGPATGAGRRGGLPVLALARLGRCLLTGAGRAGALGDGLGALRGAARRAGGSGGPPGHPAALPAL